MSVLDFAKYLRASNRPGAAGAEVPQPAASEAPVAKTRRRLFTKYVALFVAVVCIALVANGVFDVRLAVRAADVTRQLSMEHEGIVHKLCPRQVLCVHHKLVRFNPLTYRGGTGALAGEAAHTPNPIAIKAAATANKMVLRI